jgi:hypothetical protein
MKYYCQVCKQECRPRLWESGVGSDCHEADLLRPVIGLEMDELTEELLADADAERTPADRARHDWLRGS